MGLFGNDTAANDRFVSVPAATTSIHLPRKWSEPPVSAQSPADPRQRLQSEEPRGPTSVPETEGGTAEIIR